MSKEKNPSAYGVSLGPVMTACQWKGSLSTGPAALQLTEDFIQFLLNYFKSHLLYLFFYFLDLSPSSAIKNDRIKKAFFPLSNALSPILNLKHMSLRSVATFCSSNYGQSNTYSNTNSID